MSVGGAGVVATPGLPPGGLTGQVLTKESNDNFDADWEGGGPVPGTLPTGGAAGQILHKDSGTDFDASWVDNITTLPIVIDGGGAEITTGIKGDHHWDFDGELLGYTMLADQSGAIVIDIWKDTYANYPPTDADSITSGGTPPTISGPSDKSQDNTLTGWDTAFAAGDTYRFNVDSVTDIERVELGLRVRKS